MNLGNNIRDLRKEKGITQEKLAEIIGVSAQAVSKWETGQSSPDVSMILPICSVLGVSADRLLGGNHRDELEKRFQESVRLGTDAELIACEEALREYPDDKTFQYRQAVLEFFIGEEKNDRVYLRRSLSHFERLLEKYPENDDYKSYIARLYHALGGQEKAVNTAKDCKDRVWLLESILEGEELIHHRQKMINIKISELIVDLRNYGTKESLAVEDEIRRIYFGEAGEYCASRWFTYFKLGEICLSMGDGDGYAECMEKAYELAKLEDKNGITPYNSPLTDRIKKHLPDPSESDQYLSGPFAVGEATELKKRIVNENYNAKPLYQHNKWQIVSFFHSKAHSDCVNYVDYSTNWCMTEKEHEEFLSSFVKESEKSNNSGILLRCRSKQKAISLIEKGKLKGMIAWLGNSDIEGFCNCQAKNSYAALPIGEAERAVRTAECDDDKIFSIVSIDVAPSFRDCGIEERLIEDSCGYAKKNGFLYAETYIGNFDEKFDEKKNRFEKAGFYIVREYENGVFKGVILQKKL